MKKIKDAEYKITFEDRDALVDALSEYNISPEEFCYQMTAYEKGGDIDFDQGIVDILRDEISEEITVSDINEYYVENNYTDDYIYDMGEFDEVFREDNPSNIADRVYFGHYNPNDAYFKFDGNGNVKTFNDVNEVIDKDIEKWFYGNQFEDLITDDDFRNDIINGTKQLIKQGY